MNSEMTVYFLKVVDHHGRYFSHPQNSLFCISVKDMVPKYQQFEGFVLKLQSLHGNSFTGLKISSNLFIILYN